MFQHFLFLATFSRLAAGPIGPHIHENIASGNGQRRAHGAEWDWRAVKFFIPDPQRRRDRVEIGNEVVCAYDIAQ